MRLVLVVEVGTELAFCIPIVQTVDLVINTLEQCLVRIFLALVYGFHLIFIWRNVVIIVASHHDLIELWQSLDPITELVPFVENTAVVAPMEFCQCCIAQLQRTLLIEGTRQYLHHPPPIISTPSILEEAGEYTLKSFLHAAHQDLCGLEICACQELIIETISAEVIRREFERVVSNFFQLCILLDNRTGAGKYAAEGKLIPPVHRCRDIDRDKYFFSASNALARSFDLLVFDFQHTSITSFQT